MAFGRSLSHERILQFFCRLLRNMNKVQRHKPSQWRDDRSRYYTLVYVMRTLSNGYVIPHHILFRVSAGIPNRVLHGIAPVSCAILNSFTIVMSPFIIATTCTQIYIDNWSSPKIRLGACTWNLISAFLWFYILSSDHLNMVKPFINAHRGCRTNIEMKLSASNPPQIIRGLFSMDEWSNTSRARCSGSWQDRFSTDH